MLFIIWLHHNTLQSFLRVFSIVCVILLFNKYILVNIDVRYRYYMTTMLNTQQRRKHSAACYDVAINSTSKTCVREKGRDLTQSYDKSPYTDRKIQKAT